MPIKVVPIQANRPKLSLPSIGGALLPIRPHQKPRATKTGASVAPPSVIASKINPKDKPAKQPFKGPFTREKGNNHKTSQAGGIPITANHLGEEICKPITAIAEAATTTAAAAVFAADPQIKITWSHSKKNRHLLM